jgi:hypothetical protein
LAWASATSVEAVSLVQAAVINAARVLAHLILVLHYLMESRNNHYWVPKWYDRSHGQPNARDIEQYGVQVVLIHNLTVEFNRALNLVIELGIEQQPS